MAKIFTQSKNISHEYCCTIVRVGEVTPVPGSDFLGSTLVNGLTIVVRKDEVKEGDILFYAANETQLNERFLGVNNQYRADIAERNANYDEYIKEDDPEARKKMVGFFDKNSRVRMIRLKGCPSMGYLFGKDAMEKFCPEVAGVNLEELVDEDFDEVSGELFIKAYVPAHNECRSGGGKGAKRNKKIDKFDRMIPGQFSFHYDTDQLNRNMHKVGPDDVVSVSVKLHGTSGIYGNIKVRVPNRLNTGCKIVDTVANWFYSKLPFKWQKTHEEYDNIYSSRTVIKNQYINKEVGGGYYGTDVWGEYNELLKGKIAEGMIVYGEIVGYMTGAQTMIQKDYDYGCAEGTNKFMPYRITTTNEDGTKKEWNVEEVLSWTNNLIASYPEIADRIIPIQILYHGTLRNLHPEISTEKFWAEGMLAALKTEKDWKMEKNEPLCKNKVPREGIVLRIDNDEIAEAFKLKCLTFLGKEAELMDKGEVTDIEMEQKYE